MVMPEKNTNPFLIISGHISGNKRKEFEQTFRLAFSTLSGDCLTRSLSADIANEGQYYFFSVWTNDNALKLFMDSTEFLLMNGAFHALGSVMHTRNGFII
jgi:quinol monooxygenase YgiN